MTDKQKIKALKKYVSKLVSRNHDNVRTLLNVNEDNIIAVLKEYKDRVDVDKYEINDGNFATRDKLVRVLREVIEVMEELEGVGV